MQIEKFFVENLTFAKVENSDEPRILDVELADKLQYKRPESIRDLIKRLSDAGKLNDYEFFRIVRKNGERGRPATEYWLTEAQALKVIAKSETDVADAVLDDVIRVFMLARRGILQPAVRPDQIQSLIAQEVQKAIGPLMAELRSAIGVVQKHPEGILPRAELQDQPAKLAECKKLITQASRLRGVHWNSIHGELLREYQVRSYRRLPFTVWEPVREKLIAMMVAAPSARQITRQMSMFDVMN